MRAKVLESLVPWPTFAARELRSFSACRASSRGSLPSYADDMIFKSFEASLFSDERGCTKRTVVELRVKKHV